MNPSGPTSTKPSSERVPPPDEWCVRVFETAMKVTGFANRYVLDDEYISAILLKMRIGEFKEFNLNGVKRYNRNLFRCHVCNAVLRAENGVPPNTAAHVDMHKKQVRQALNIEGRYIDDWTYAVEPTLEEVQKLDAELELEARIRDKGNELFVDSRYRTR